MTILKDLIYFPANNFYFNLLVTKLYTTNFKHYNGEKTQHYFSFVIPAHNEENNIKQTIESCLQVDYPNNKFNIYVIADNCTDKTAEIAKQSKAYVYERFSETQKSKGYALEEFFPKLIHENEQLDAIVIIDADTLIATNMLKNFSYLLSQNYNWIQCYYSVSNSDVSWRTKLLTYSFSLFNGVWLMGQISLNLGATLRGNGMCFSKQALKNCPWHAYGLAEDMEFSWYLRLLNEKSIFSKYTNVKGEMVSKSGNVADNQRLRWENGRQILVNEFNQKIKDIKNISFFKKLLYLQDLNFPPLGRYVLSLLLYSMVFFIAQWFCSYLILQFINYYLWFSVLFLCIYIISPFILLKLPIKYVFSFLYIPVYFVWKFWLIFKTKPTTWIRTEREKKDISL